MFHILKINTAFTEVQMQTYSIQHTFASRLIFKALMLLVCHNLC